MPNPQSNMYGDSSFAVAIETKNQGFYEEIRSIDTAFDKYSAKNAMQFKRRNKQSGLITVVAILFIMVGGIVVGATTGMIQSSDKIEAKASFDESLLAGKNEVEMLYDRNKLPQFSENEDYKFNQKLDGSIEIETKN